MITERFAQLVWDMEEQIIDGGMEQWLNKYADDAEALEVLLGNVRPEVRSILERALAAHKEYVATYRPEHWQADAALRARYTDVTFAASMEMLNKYI